MVAAARRAESALRVCAHSGCPAEGTHRAPQDREDLRSYVWFCLDHVREYNKAWDFFSGMSRSQIEAFRVDAITGHRPTWPIGLRAAQLSAFARKGLRDAFGVLGGGSAEAGAAAPALTREHRDALAVLDLGAAADAEEMKARYKQLVKRFHPDANGGDKTAEERFKTINQAYTFLRSSVS